VQGLGSGPGKGIEARRFARVRPSGLVSASARIYEDKKGAPVIDCNVIDVSSGGFCLETVRDVAVPSRFILLHGGVKKRGRLVWKKGQRFGVAF